MVEKKQKPISSCLDSFQMAEFLSGATSSRDFKKISDHLKVCGSCHTLVDSIEDVTAQQDQNDFYSVPVKHTQKIKDLFISDDEPSIWDVVIGCTDKILTELKTNGEIIVGLKTTGLVIRGDKKLGAKVVLLEKTFQRVKVQAEVSSSKMGYSLRIIAGTTDQPMTGDFRATLCVHSEELESYMLTSGTAIYEGLAFGDYEILFSRNGDLIGNMSFSLREL